VLHLGAYRLQIPQLSIAAMLIGIYGAMGLAWGPQWLMRSLFPFCLMIFCVPFAQHLDFLTTRLQLLVCTIVAGICHFILGIDVIREGAILKDPANQYHYEVIAACAGIRSLIGIGLMAVVMAFLTFRGWWRRGLLVVAAVPLAVISNVVRLLAVIIAASVGGQDAGNYVHDGGPGGLLSLLPYAIAFAGLYYLANWLEKREVAPAVAR
jgi:exosortase